MHHFLVLALFLAYAVSINVRTQNVDEVGFQNWMTQHKRVYSSESEYSTRLGIFADNIVRIAQLNKDSDKFGGARFNLTKFSDLTPAEFKQKFLNNLITLTPDSEKDVYELPVGVTVGDAFDWKSKGKITAVKDQGQCGSCWAFSATENIESVWMIAKDITASSLDPLAPQQIVDCDKSDGGCNGGNPPTAYNYIVSAGGQEPERDYPYEARDQSCRFNRADVEVKITGYKYATRNGDENAMKSMVATVAPISICVDAEPWQSYSGGIMTRAQCGTSLDHCVQITGYDTSASTPYWSVRNSWGSDWGEDGYIRLEFGTNTCGLTQEATTAIA